MNIYAEIYNRRSSRYWRRGIFVLRNVGGEHYWYPFCELYINDSTVEFDVICVLEKRDSETCEIVSETKRGAPTPRGHGYALKPGDIPEVE